MRNARVHTAWVRAVPLDGSQRDGLDAKIGDGKSQLVVTSDDIWVAHADSRSLTRLDPDSLEIKSTRRLGKAYGKSPIGLAVLGNETWVLSRNGWLWRDAGSSELVGFQRLGRGSRALVATADRMFALRSNGQILELDPAGSDPELRARSARGARHLAVSGKHAWVATHLGRRVARIELDSGDASSSRMPARVVALVADGDTCWVACWSALRRRGELLELDAQSGTISARHSLQHKPRDLTLDGNDAWLAEQTRGGLWHLPDGRLRRYTRGAASPDPREISTGWPPDRIAVSGERMITTMSVNPPSGTGGSGAS